MVAHSLHSIALLVLLSTSALADLSCAPYTPQDSSKTTGTINFTGQNGESNIPSTNATSGSPVFLDTSHANAGTILNFQLCQSNSLSVSQEVSSPPLSSPGPGCQSTFKSPVRLVDPSTGGCLTRRPSASNSGHFEIFVQACNSNPTTKVQFWQVMQTVFYADCNAPSSYSTQAFFPWGYDMSNQYANPQSPWVIGADGQTVLFNPLKQAPASDSLVSLVISV